MKSSHTLAESAPLGAYPATRCPVRLQWDLLRPAEPAPTPDFFVALAQSGIDFEVEVFDEIESLVEGAVRIDQDATASAREQLTVEAMTAGASVVLAGRLPVDVKGSRVALPDVLLRVGDAPVDGRWRYVPVDVKSHGTTVEDGAGVVVQQLDGLAVPDEGTGRLPVGRRDATTRKDLLQLAHYWRTLQAHGAAPDGPVWAGVLGAEAVVAWYRLDEPMWQIPDNGEQASGVRVSTLDLYDQEFAFRVAVAATCADFAHDPSTELLVEPVWFSECPTCPWRDHCHQILEERQDISLLPRVNRTVRSALHDFGTTTMPALAALPRETTVATLRPGQVANAIDQARARLGPEPAYRRHGVASIEVPRFDIEIDVDMENVEQGAYLWGTFVTDVSGTGVVSDGYRAFVRWEPDSEDAGGAAAFLDFWRWLGDIIRRCDVAGVSLGAYCWSAGAENRWLRVGATANGLSDEVESFIDSARWTDLLRVFSGQVITGYGNGLKTVATLTGFSWRDDDPGGGQSMLWWQTATDPSATDSDREQSRQRLLTYNEDDVRATLHVRNWLHEHAATVPTVPIPT